MWRYDLHGVHVKNDDLLFSSIVVIAFGALVMQAMRKVLLSSTVCVAQLYMLRRAQGSTTLIVGTQVWLGRNKVMVVAALVYLFDRIGFFLGGALCGPRLCPLVVGSEISCGA